MLGLFMGKLLFDRIALLLFAGLREKMETVEIPEVFKGAAIALITAGILSLAFMGFSGIALDKVTPEETPIAATAPESL